MVLAFTESNFQTAVGHVRIPTEIEAEPEKLAVAAPQPAAAPQLAAAPPPPASVTPETASSRITVDGTPGLEYFVLLKAKLETKRTITKGGKESLEKMSASGKLARNFVSSNPLDTAMFSKRYLRLDNYRLVGNAGYRLRARLLVAGERGDSQGVPLDAELKSNRDLIIAARDRDDASGLVNDGIELGSPSTFVSVTEADKDISATKVLLKRSLSFARKFLHGVPSAEIQRFLEQLFASIAFADVQLADDSKAARDEHLRRAVTRSCVEAADLYRNWYRTRWAHMTMLHDSQLHVGQILYRFSPDGTLIGKPGATGTEVVYRFLRV